MKEFLNKNKKTLIIILATILLLGIAAAVYFFVFDGKLFDTSNEDSLEQKEVTPLPEFEVRSSGEAIELTYEQAKEWSEDVELYNCTGIPTSVQFEDIKYSYVGVDNGNYYRWMCTYYSPSKKATKIFVYVGGNLEPNREAVDIGEYGYLMYDSIDYPTDLTAIADSTEIYANAQEEGLDGDTYYVNMYLSNSMDYGFVWKVEERSKTELDEYQIGELENIYIFNPLTGELIEKTQEEIY